MSLKHRNPDFWIPALGIASLLITFFILNYRSCFWGDEVLTYLLVTLPTPAKMWAALADQVDSTPPLFYLVAWVWARITGLSESSLRFLSCLGILVSFVFTWRALRLAYPWKAAALGITAAFCSSLIVVRQLSEARAYGFFLMFASVALWLFARRATRDDPPGFGLTIGYTLSHAALVLTHYFGFLYSGIYLLTTMLADVRRRLFHLRLYVAVLVGWSAFLPWLEPMARHRQSAIPHSWIPVPKARELLASFAHTLPLALLLLGWWWIAHWRALSLTPSPEQKSSAPEPEAHLRVRQDLSLLALILICLPPVVAWVLSNTFVSVFWDRYFLPSTLGWAIVWSSLALMWFPELRESTLGEESSSLRKQIAAVLLAGQLLLPWMYAVLWPKSHCTWASRLSDHPSLPVVVSSATDFLELTHRSPTPERYYFLLDWEAAVSRGNSLGAVDDFHSMSGVKRHFPHLQIIPWERFFEMHDKFLVLDDNEFIWFEMRLQCNPQFTYEFLNNNIILVTKSCGHGG